MRVLKWAFIAISCLTLAFIGVGWRTFHLMNTAPAEQLSLADLQIGGSTSPSEHAALIDACLSGHLSRSRARCACVATEEEKNMSRYARLYLVAIMNRDMTRAFGILKGMDAAGATQQETDAALSGLDAPALQAWMAKCRGAEG